MSWKLPVRVAFVTLVGLLFIWSLLGILVTGPIVLRAEAVDLDLDNVSPARLRADVERLCGEFSPRSYLNRDNLDRAAEWIAGEFGAAGLKVESQEYEIDGGRYRNVIARRAGSDPEGRAIVVGAHYDAYAEHAGADDNASGVAVLLELARTLPQDRSKRTQFFVAFSTEEPPFFRSDRMGSYVFARKLIDDGVEVDLMLALDLVGYYRDEPGSQRLPFPGMGLLYPDTGNFVAVTGDLEAGPWIRKVKYGMKTVDALPVHSFRAPPRWAPVDLSDHLSFRRLGLPGVLVTDTAFMRYPHYHEPEDTPEKLDYERMALLVKNLHGVLYEGKNP